MRIRIRPRAEGGAARRRRLRLIGTLGTALLAVAVPMFASGAAQAATGTYTSFGVADWDADGHQDIVTRNNGTSDLWLYPGEGHRGYSAQAPVKIGNGWGGYTPFGVADWDGDGHKDIIVRNDTTADLWLYPGEGHRAYSWQTPVKIGNGWNGYTPFGVADWDGDGHQDIVVRNDTTNDLWLYPGEGVRGYSWQTPVKIGNGWGGYTPFGLADWDSDGHQDIIVRNDTTADLWLYPGEGHRGYSWQAPVKIGNGW
ncbi:FG-GAP repeat domain-containing protein [Actinacidiphila acididurans]|uniref:VCBS repeat-containing protein n=1 Tax=Actinacidiphila acididurans TaxID=2784346 RepID=A0ABS2TWZ2_9ACTN|nr:VCBS repeat-containing protein [Actinacidiphila acididurans]MBM9507861.1 VCBS repeat-containing protein [Actinacidiphila acididurans]